MNAVCADSTGDIQMHGISTLCVIIINSACTLLYKVVLITGVFIILLKNGPLSNVSCLYVIISIISQCQ